MRKLPSSAGSLLVHCKGGISCNSCLTSQFLLPFTSEHEILPHDFGGAFSFDSLELEEDLEI